MVESVPIRTIMNMLRDNGSTAPIKFGGSGVSDSQ